MGIWCQSDVDTMSSSTLIRRHILRHVPAGTHLVRHFAGHSMSSYMTVRLFIYSFIHYLLMYLFFSQISRNLLLHASLATKINLNEKNEKLKSISQLASLSIRAEQAIRLI